MVYVIHVLAAAALFTAGPPAFAQTDPRADVQQAEKLIDSGDPAGAAAMLEKTVAAAPKSFDARLVFGRALDLAGRHAAARQHLEEAVKLATDEQRVEALAALGVSYAFESKADEAARYYQRAFDVRVQADDHASAAGLANALGRVYLESGDLRKAEQWYTTGMEMARKIPGRTPSQTALWEMRWHHAQARIAARRGNKASAQEHADAVRTALEKGVDEFQRSAYPYLLGYIAYYSKDYRRAIDELAKADQEDVFILGLTAQAYQKLGDREKAAEYFRKVMASGAHSINAAFARPPARAFLR
jgi:tetratricopeptide (TPR) repeat protein